MDIAIQLFLVCILILLNGFFVASEFALVNVRKTRINELVKRGNRAAILVQRAQNDLTNFISATQLGITIASIALGWIGEPALARLISLLFGFLPNGLAVFSANIIAIILSFSAITFLHIVLGELAPKTIALQKSEKVAQLIISPMLFFSKIFQPFIFLLTTTGTVVLKMFGFSPLTPQQFVHSESEIKMILSQSAESGVIDKREAEMVYKVFKLGDIPIENIMVHRTEIQALNVSIGLQDVFPKIESTPFSRFPVYENSKDNIIGFVHIRDLYKSLLENKDNKRLSELNILRKIISVPKSRRADDVLLDMRRKRIHIAVVSDDAGGTAGIVTLEDIIENVVGDIHDEFEEQNEDIKKQEDDSYLIEGSANIEKVKGKFNIPIRGQGYTTIGGLVFGLLGREPRVGDVLQIGNISLDVLSVEGRRIQTIKLKKLSKK